MRCKKEIMGLAALKIVLYHFYIPFGNSMPEVFMIKSTYIGVDLFFFVSACSLANRSKNNFNYGQFIFNRFTMIYLPFVALSIIGAIYKKWAIADFFKVILGVQFVQKGGGSFLWYFIGIMIIYLLVPLFVFVKNKFKLYGLGILMVFWVLVSCLFQFAFPSPQLFILINRLPIFFIGMYYEELVRANITKLGKWVPWVISLVLMGVGMVLIYKFATVYRLIKPFSDMYYIIAIPMILGTVILIDVITTALEKKYKSKILKFIGGITLELYGLQMIFGYDIEIKFLKVVPVKQLAFVGVVIILIALAFIFNRIIALIRKGVNLIGNKNLETKEIGK